MNKGCLHAGCLSCWRIWAGSQLRNCRAQGWLRPPCFEPGCRQPMDVSLWEHLAAMSPDTFAFSNEIADLRLMPSDSMVWVSRPTLEKGPACQSCGSLHPALIKNAQCDHAVCRHCWSKSVEAELESCSSEGRNPHWPLDPPCSVEGCRAAASNRVQIYLRLVSKPFIDFESNFDLCVKDVSSPHKADLQALQNSARDGHHKLSVPMPCKSGEAGMILGLWPICPICCEVHIALISMTVNCLHFSCLSCLTMWAREQLPIYRCTRSLFMSCFVCHADVDSSLQKLVYGRDPATRNLDKQLKRRLQLQRNPLYPSPVQVDCPNADCMGLGYLAHETVMCFICEHQWSSDGARADEIGMLSFKQCPSCKAYIEKDGGCDHMTCRCRCEFWWSTGAPYRR